MECKICMEPFDNGDRLPKTIIPCGHTACLKCLQHLQNQECPTCRQMFLGSPTSFPNNFALVELLQNSKLDRTEESKARGWCSKCRATASPQCWAQHDVLAVSAALEQRLQDVLPALPQVPGQLEGLKDQCQEEKAVHALTLLTGSSWHLTLRGEDRALSGTLRSTEDPITKALLVLAAAKAELTEDTYGNRSSTYTVDLQNDLTTDEATNMDIIRGVVRLLKVQSSRQKLLLAAAPTLEQLDVFYPSPDFLRAILALPRLKRLRVEGANYYNSKQDTAAMGILLQELPTTAPQPVQWLEMKYPGRDALVVLLRTHRLTLETLRLEAEEDYLQMGCGSLFSLLRECDLRVLKRLVLKLVLEHVHNKDNVRGSKSLDQLQKWQQYQEAECARQRAVVRRALPAGAEVLCWDCDTRARMEVF